MNHLFASFRPAASNPSYSIRRPQPMATSGVPVLFASVMGTPPLKGAKRPFFTPLVEFVETLLQPEGSTFSTPEPNPWIAPRQLQVPQLPSPPFHAFPPARSFAPARSDADAFEPSPLMRDTAEESPRPVPNSNTILASLAASIPMEGILKQDPSGFVYLDIAPAFATAIKEENCTWMTPRIPVILADEAKAKEGWGAIKELGQKFSFTLTGLYSVSPANMPHLERLWFYTLQSPALSMLRERYLHRSWRSFNLTAGAQTRNSKQTSAGLYRLNVSCYAA